MKKRGRVSLIIAAVLLSATLLVAGGCGGGGESESNVLKIGYLKAGFGSEWIEGVAERFMTANPGVQVKLEGNYQMPSIVSSRMESQKNLSDIFYAQSGVWQQWVIKDWIEPLDSVYEADIDGTKYVDKLEPDIRNIGKLYGKYYAVPLNDNVTGFVYNVKMFREKGWVVPKTVADLMTLVQEIKRDGSAKPFVFCGKTSGGYWDFPLVSWWAQYEGVDKIREFMQFGDKSVFAQTGRLKALEVLYDILSDTTNYVPGVLGLDNYQAQSAFLQGKAAMIPCASYFETEMKDALKANPDFEYGMMAYPVIDGAKPVDGEAPRVNYTCGGEVFFVPKKAANKELAKKFLAFMAKDECLRFMLEKMVTPQPFLFDTTPVESKLSTFGQQCLEIWKNSYNLTLYSDNPMYLKGYVGLWPTPGFHQTRMISDPEAFTARACYQSDIDVIEANWDRYRQDAGLTA